MLLRLQALGLKKEDVYQYQSLIYYYSSLEDNVLHDLLADIMDYIIGWYYSQKNFWK